MTQLFVYELLNHGTAKLLRYQGDPFLSPQLTRLRTATSLIWQHCNTRKNFSQKVLRFHVSFILTDYHKAINKGG